MGQLRSSEKITNLGTTEQKFATLYELFRLHKQHFTVQLNNVSEAVKDRLELSYPEEVLNNIGMVIKTIRRCGKNLESGC